MGIHYTIGSLQHNLSIEIDFFAEQLQKKWLNVKIYHPPQEAHSKLQWNFDTEWQDNIVGDLYEDGVAFRTFDNKSIGTFACWFRSIIPASYELVLYKNDLSHHPITLHNAITDEEIQQGFNVPFDESKYK